MKIQNNTESIRNVGTLTKLHIVWLFPFRLIKSKISQICPSWFQRGGRTTSSRCSNIGCMIQPYLYVSAYKVLSIIRYRSSSRRIIHPVIIPFII